MPPSTKKKKKTKKITQGSSSSSSSKAPSSSSPHSSSVVDDVPSQNTVDDASETQEMEELIQHAKELEAKCNKEEAVVDEFRQRLEKLQHFWDAEKIILEKRKDVLKEKQGTFDSTKEEHQIKLDGKRKEIKQLLDKQEDEYSRAEIGMQFDQTTLQSKHKEEENALVSDRHECQARLREIELSHDDLVKRVQDEHSNQITKLRNDFRHRSSDIATYSEHELRRTRDELEAKKLEDVKQVESSIEDRVEQILTRHDKEMEGRRQHYNSLVRDNLDTISSLKDKTIRLRKESRLERNLEDITVKNRNVVQSLAHATQEVEGLVEKDAMCKRQKEQLNKHQEQLHTSQEELNDLKFRHEVLYQKCEAVEKERDVLKQKATATSHIVARQKGHSKKTQQCKVDSGMCSDPLAGMTITGKGTAAEPL